MTDGSGASPLRRAERRRRRRQADWLRWGARLVLVLVVFGLGVAFGAALHDNPRPGGLHTDLRTLPPAGNVSTP